MKCAAWRSTASAASPSRIKTNPVTINMAVGCYGGACKSSGLTFRPQRPPADVAAVEAAFPMDAGDCVIGAFLSFRHILAQRGDVKDAPTHRHNLATPQFRAGMEQGDARQRLGGVQAK